ncbi:hypothetical protein TNIN_295241 [Trichonephila inaurata madagascariensis]|uniref:Uncharacterized protein n=1 Tax=Trichonephila inaurata madagascariensis TaxID=2747483 RepID=A0A8X6XFP8_9ARAC|nr:hypothetical protein TNIN_295241 [Trichonephila inaurata madagascariensis]
MNLTAGRRETEIRISKRKDLIYIGKESRSEDLLGQKIHIQQNHGHGRNGCRDRPFSVISGDCLPGLRKSQPNAA